MEVYTFSEHTDLNEEIYLLQKGIDIVQQLFDGMTYKSPVNYSMSFFLQFVILMEMQWVDSENDGL